MSQSFLNINKHKQDWEDLGLAVSIAPTQRTIVHYSHSN